MSANKDPVGETEQAAAQRSPAAPKTPLAKPRPAERPQAPAPEPSKPSEPASATSQRQGSPPAAPPAVATPSEPPSAEALPVGLSAATSSSAPPRPPPSDEALPAGFSTVGGNASSTVRAPQATPVVQTAQSVAPWSPPAEQDADLLGDPEDATLPEMEVPGQAATPFEAAPQSEISQRHDRGAGLPFDAPEPAGIDESEQIEDETTWDDTTDKYSTGRLFDNAQPAPIAEPVQIEDEVTSDETLESVAPESVLPFEIPPPAPSPAAEMVPKSDPPTNAVPAEAPLAESGANEAPTTASPVRDSLADGLPFVAPQQPTTAATPEPQSPSVDQPVDPAPAKPKRKRPPPPPRRRQAAKKPSQPTPSTAASTDSNKALTAATRAPSKLLPQTKVEDYASFRASWDAFPDRRSSALSQYGIADETALTALEQNWHARFELDPSLQQKWTSLYEHYLNWYRQGQS